jgi:hypothetical protein
MELQSRQRLRRSPPPLQQHGDGDPHGDDRISALPDDMIFEVLACLNCACAAARTDILSRRWRGLWARLPNLAFRDVPASVITEALSHLGRGTTVSLLEIRLSRSTSGDEWKLDDGRAKRLMKLATRLSPEVLVFTLPVVIRRVKVGHPVDIALSPFSRAKSIEVDTRFLRIKAPLAGATLPVLEMLSVSGNIVNLHSLLDLSSRLRVLGVTFRRADQDNLDAGLAVLQEAASTGLVVSRLGIEYDHSFKLEYMDTFHSIDADHFASLLRTAATISPQELVFTNTFYGRVKADLLCFRLAVSIEMNLYSVRFAQLPDGEFSALERLWLMEGSSTVDLAALVACCPRLRVLKVTADESRSTQLR